MHTRDYINNCAGWEKTLKCALNLQKYEVQEEQKKREAKPSGRKLSGYRGEAFEEHGGLVGKSLREITMSPLHRKRQKRKILPRCNKQQRNKTNSPSNQTQYLSRNGKGSFWNKKYWYSTKFCRNEIIQ